VDKVAEAAKSSAAVSWVIALDLAPLGSCNWIYRCSNIHQRQDTTLCGAAGLSGLWMSKALQMPGDQIEVPKITPRLQLRIRSVCRGQSEPKLNYSLPKTKVPFHPSVDHNPPPYHPNPRISHPQRAAVPNCFRYQFPGKSFCFPGSSTLQPQLQQNPIRIPALPV